MVLTLEHNQENLTEETLQADRPSNVKGKGELYDASLNYRAEVAGYVAGKLAGSTHLQVGAYNEYPVVMVHFDVRNFLSDSSKMDKKLEAPRNDFNQFLMSHYAGIVNAEAAKKGLNTATVERSSFGHSTPSVASTNDSFRINLGMMPPAYAEAHISALKILDQELSSFKENLNKGGSHTVKLQERRYDLSAHRDELMAPKNILELAFTKADSSNKTLMTNTVRTLQARNSVDSDSYHAHRNLPAGGHNNTRFTAQSL
ncbi:hypothetical protein AAKU55_003664 [Oxalobacteraceae bacterium GrIS 1.11]